MNQKDRFIRWRERTAPKTRYLVDAVLQRIAPEFEKHGFVWYPDFAGDDAREIGANEIPLQQRLGSEWPTVQIYFYKGNWGPRFRIAFAALPEMCRSLIQPQVPRDRAVAQYGPAYFYLSRGKWRDYRDTEFGFNWMPMLLPRPSDVMRLVAYSSNWKRYLDAEVAAALALLPGLFELFDKGIPTEWVMRARGPVSEHVRLVHSWKIWDSYRART